MKPSGDLSYKGKRQKQIPRRFAPRDDNAPETAEAARLRRCGRFAQNDNFKVRRARRKSLPR
jgi:hypothetical protein